MTGALLRRTRTRAGEVGTAPQSAGGAAPSPAQPIGDTRAALTKPATARDGLDERAEPTEAPTNTRLVVFADDWGRHASSCQHLVGELLDRYPALWVNTIGTRLPQLSLDDARKIAGRLWDWAMLPRIGQRLPANLRVLSPPMWPGFRTRWQRNINARLISRAVNRALGPGRPPELRIAITTLPLTADLIGPLEVDRWIYYCVDDFASWPGLDGRVMWEMEQDLVRRAHRVVAVSNVLQRRLAEIRPDVLLVTHGVDPAHWSLTQTPAPAPSAVRRASYGEKDLARPAALPDWWLRLERPVMLFWGVVDERLDADWCRRLVDGPGAEGTLVLVGPGHSHRRMLECLDRLVTPGPIPYVRLPVFAADADVLVMPYADLPVTRAMQPLKLKEYLATDRPVVARSLPATRQWADAGDVVETAEAFVALVRERARTGLPRSQREARLGLAVESWRAKAHQFEAVLASGLGR